MQNNPIAFRSAYRITMQNVTVIGSETLPLEFLTDRVLAEDAVARVNSPSVTASLKDGYAVRSKDIERASPESPVTLTLTGTTPAGSTEKFSLCPGAAVRVLTGASLPAEADAVLAEEFTSRRGKIITAHNHAEPGRNILQCGTDVREGETILTKGTRLHPAAVGLLASAGLSSVQVFRRPSAALLAAGDEVIAPGSDLEPGKLFASNLVTLASWCSRNNISTSSRVLKDSLPDIQEAVSYAAKNHDVVITSGGAWSSERDLVVRALEGLGWEQLYHRVRMGPGKGIAFGILNKKPVFCLPGGPPSNLAAFLQLALPALQQMAGLPDPGLQETQVVLDQPVSGQSDWTQFIFGSLSRLQDNTPRFTPLQTSSRLQLLASAQAVLTVPEGTAEYEKDVWVTVQILT
jgi:molybdopterin molybdotransferase